MSDNKKVFRRSDEEKPRPRIAASLAGTGALVAGAGTAYAGLRVGKAANKVGQAATESAKAARNTRVATAGIVRTGRKIERASRFIKRKIAALPLLSKVRFIDGRVVVELARERKELPAEVKAGLSAGASGALVGAVIPALKRKSTLRQIVKSAGVSGASTAALIGGGAWLGSRILGKPSEKDPTAFTKRAAVGATIAGTIAGSVAGVAAHKYRPLRVGLKKLAKTNRPAHWVVKSGPVGATLIGGAGGGIYGAAQGADEGMQVDTINNIKRQQKRHRFESGVIVCFGADGPELIQFSGPELRGRLAADRYKKKIQDDDLDRRDANAGRAAVAGAAVGALMRGRLSPLKRAAVGATAGVAGVLAVRRATEHTKDIYGERSRGGKKVEKAPAIIGAGAAGLLAYRRLRGVVPVRLSDGRIMIQFGRKDQPRYVDSKKYANPLAAYGDAAPLVDAQGNNTRLTQSQLVNAAWRGGQKIRKTVRRGGNLINDVSEVASGRPRTSNRKREWEKEWFRNTVLTAGGAGALLAHAVARRKLPVYRARTDAIERVAKAKVAKVRRKVDGALGLNSTAREIFFARLEATFLLDALAQEAGWDLRDARGKSARVFAPGSKRRQRRPKEWHEKVDNQRTILGGLAAAGTAAGLVGGILIGRKLPGARQALPQPRAWRRSGYRTKKFVNATAQFRKAADQA